jgi:subtilisin family serine protease
MTTHWVRARLARILTTATVTALVASIALASTALADSPGRSKLSKEDHQRLAAATANGSATVTMLFATVESSTGSVASALSALGATVRKQDSDVGYIRADVPTDKADAAAKLAGVVASELDQVFDLIPPGIDGDVIAAIPPENTPAQNAYMPTRDTGAPQFVAAHPTWDGRGVTIGILDTGVDIGHPALQATTTGERKIVDWITYTDPATDGDPSWIAMTTTVTVVGGTFTVGTGATARTYTGAPDGTWRYGAFVENTNLFQRTNGSAAPEYRIASCSNHPATGGGDLNRNGVCDEVFAFLWDGSQNGFVWRDSDADSSFADEVGIRDYKKDFAVGEYGHDNAATAIRESVPFVTQIDAAAGFVSLGVVSGAHATHVAGIAAGGTLFGSATGAAPGAKIVSIRVCLFTSGCTAHALTEGMIYAAKNAHVDVISMSIGGLPGLNDGNNARAILYNRLIDKWGAEIFLSAGNSGPGVNTIGDPAVATKAMAIGAYWTKESVLANYGNTVVSDEALHDFSSRGPREDGGFKPEVVAPGNATSSVPTWQAQQCLAPIVCSPGLGMFNGTSMAAPQASGAAALLLSAAIPSGVGHKPAQLREAMTSSARYLTNYQAHEQGFGLINVGAAWDLLKTNLKTVEISSTVPVNTVLKSFLATPGIGTGIYDREGVHPGDAAYVRTYTFTRSDGGTGTYNLSWLGNDGSFALPAGQTTLSFANKGSATLAIGVTPRASSGVSSAILRLDDPTTPGIEYATMNTVITSIPLSPSNSYKATVAGSARRFEAGQPKAFFDVPADTTALRMTLTVINGRVNATAVHPYGLPQTAASQAIPLTTGPATVSRVLTVTPVGGVWEIVDAASRAAVPASSTYEVTFEAYRVSLDPATWTNPHTTVGAPYTQTFTAKNEFAAATTVQTAIPFASVRTVTGSISAGSAQQSYDITVPPGTTQLQVTLGGASDPGADLDLFVYNCTTGTCVLAGSSTGSTANETVTIGSPAVGAWKAIVDPFAVPAVTTTYTYTDSFSNPTYGSVTVPANVPTLRAAGATWTFDATGTANAVAGTGRFLRSSVAVRLDASDGPILGSALVIFEDVTP